MSGPPYPHPNPAPGSNAIGRFRVGVSPVGDISPFDPYNTLISQYANSPVIDSLVLAMNAAIDQTQNIDAFFDMMMNVVTAQGYGLDVWGRIVNVGRVVVFPTNASFFGFNEAGTSWTGFNQSGFFGGSGTTTNFALSDNDYRRLIFAKALANISDGSIKSLNSILLTLFPGRGNCRVIDTSPEPFDPAQIFAPIHITDNNLEVFDSSGGLGGNLSGRSLDSSVTQTMFYFEALMGVSGGGNGIGICNVSASAGQSLTQSLNAFGYFSDGNVYFNSGVITNIGSFGNGDVVDMAVDVTHQRIWFRKNAGNWNNNGAANPTTGVGFISFPAGLGAGPWFAAVEVRTGGQATSTYFNPAPINFTYLGQASRANPMALTLLFPFSLSPVELAIVGTAGVLPTPAGRIVNIVHS